MKFEPRHADEDNVNVESKDYLAEFLKLTGILLGLVVGVYLVLGFAAEKLAEHLPPRYEQIIAGSFLDKLDKHRFPKTAPYVQGVLDRLVAASGKTLPPFTYRIIIVDDEAVNAMALPAGNIVVFRGLLAQLDNENELAMVLGHELGHYAHRDHLRGLGRGLVLLAITSALGVTSGIPGFIAPAVQTFDLKFSRDQESNADAYGLDLVVKAYGHAGGALNIFGVLSKEERKHGGHLEFFSTHPDSIWRKLSMADRIHALHYPKKDTTLLPGDGALPLPGEPIKEAK